MLINLRALRFAPTPLLLLVTLWLRGQANHGDYNCRSGLSYFQALSVCNPESQIQGGDDLDFDLDQQSCQSDSTDKHQQHAWRTTIIMILLRQNKTERISTNQACSRVKSIQMTLCFADLMTRLLSDMAEKETAWRILQTSMCLTAVVTTTYARYLGGLFLF